MLKIPQTVEVKWVSANKKHYINKGYSFTNMFDIFECDVRDLTKGSCTEVEFICDFCGKDYIRKFNNRNQGESSKDCCGSFMCRNKKSEETYFKKHGVKKPSQKEDYKFYTKYNLEKATELFCDIGLELLEELYINIKTPMKCRCLVHPDSVMYKTLDSVLLKHKTSCKRCFSENNSKENAFNWKGGITPLSNMLRKEIQEWNTDSMIKCKYRCVISGGKFDTVHHLHNFSCIIRESLRELELPLLKNCNEYKDKELQLIIEKVREVHYRYPLGVCLRGDIHDLFHSIYGKTNNTPEQFYEFKLKIEKGEVKIEEREVV